MYRVHDGEFIRDGCLVILIAMALSGDVGEKELPLVSDAIQRLEGLPSTYENPRTAQLLAHLRDAIGNRPSSKLIDWVLREYVRPYFCERCQLLGGPG